MMKFFNLVLLSLVSTAYCLSQSDYNTIMDALDNNWRGKPLIQPKALRLAFHDCVTVCDGCLNMTDSSNAGLQDIIDDLEVLYPTYSSLVSRADFWMMAGMSSINAGIRINNRQCVDDSVLPCTTMPDLTTTFRSGRVDCADSPYFLTGTQREFPNPRMTASEMFAYYARTDGPGFSFSSDEVAALMGAHTMGSMTRANSGHVGPWMNNRTIQFNNQYYSLMLSSAITWENFNPSNPRQDPRYQWRATDSSGTIYGNFINTDMETLYDLPLDSDFATTTCSVNGANPTCPQSATYAKASSYAASADTWMTDFSAVFEKMIENGYDSLENLTS